MLRFNAKNPLLQRHMSRDTEAGDGRIWASELTPARSGPVVTNNARDQRDDHLLRKTVRTRIRLGNF